tara:strand:+ start:1721 stop:2452 length:732 start_codon:yes stop_codon:yes gene_type:complete
MKVFKIILIIIQFKSLSAILMTRSSFISTANNYLSCNVLNNAYYGDEPETKPDTEPVSKPEKVEISFEKDNQNPLTINFYTPVSSDSCMVLAAMLKKMDTKARELEIQYDYRFPIKLHMQSLGGELMPSFYICDLIKNIETPVHVYVDGYVASAAASIAVCGDKRFMTKHSSILIHQLKSSSTGKFNEMKEEMSNLNLFMNNLREIFLENTKLTEKELETLLFSDIWLPSEKCIEYGIVDEII